MEDFRRSIAVPPNFNCVHGFANDNVRSRLGKQKIVERAEKQKDQLESVIGKNSKFSER